MVNFDRPTSFLHFDYTYFQSPFVKVLFSFYHNHTYAIRKIDSRQSNQQKQDNKNLNQSLCKPFMEYMQKTWQTTRSYSKLQHKHTGKKKKKILEQAPCRELNRIPNL